MAIDPNAVGQKGQPSNRSWNSKDALLYAVGIGAGIDELQYTTENTKDVVQKVFPTFAVIIGGGGIPMKEVGSFNPALTVHGEQGIELLGIIVPLTWVLSYPLELGAIGLLQGVLIAATLSVLLLGLRFQQLYINGK